MRLLILAQIVVFQFIVTSCGALNLGFGDSDEIEDKEKETTEQKDVVGSDENGTAVGNFIGDVDYTQVLNVNSGNIAGASLSIPPGTLNINVDITLSESEETPGSSDSIATAGLNGEVQSAGPALDLSPSTPVRINNPMTLSLPTGDGAGLYLNDDVFPAVFVIVKDSFGNIVERKIIKSDDVTVEGSVAKIQTSDFGIYQFAFVTVKIEENATPIELEIAGDFRGQSIDLQQSFADSPEVYEAYGIQVNFDRSVYGFFKTTDPNAAGFTPLPLSLPLGPVIGERLKKWVFNPDEDEVGFVVYSADNSAVAIFYLRAGYALLAPLQKGNYTYPPSSAADLTASQLAGKFSGDSLQLEPGDETWQAKTAEVKAWRRSKIELVEDTATRLELKGDLLGKPIESGLLSIDTGSTYHKYHGGMSGTVQVGGKTYEVRTLHALNKNSLTMAICWDEDPTVCWNGTSLVPGGPSHIVYVHAVKKVEE